MNRVVLIGRLTKDPDLKFIPSTGNPVVTFNLAVDRRIPNKEGVREADFIPVVVYGKIAESIANYVNKGKLIGVTGRIQTRNYEAKDGTKRYLIEVIADEVQFLEWGKKNEGSNHNAEYEAAGITPIDDGDVPF